MRTGERSLVRFAAFLAVAAVTMYGMAGAAMAGVCSRSGSVAIDEASGMAPLAEPGGSDNGSGGPVLSGIAAVGITETGATIVWETDVLATSQVDYGENPAYGQTASSGMYATAHSVGLDGLTASTEYHYRVVSSGLFLSGTTESADFIFTTAGPADQAGPAISGVTTENVTASSAIIRWTTDEDADSQVQYGSTTNYVSTTILDPTLSRSHSVALTGLVYGTQYHYRVKSADAPGNVSQSDDYTFTTIDNMPPVVSLVKLVDVTPTSVTVTWNTDEKADSQVEYGPDVYYGFTTAADTALVTSHRVTITGLNPGTWYNCRALSKDASGNLRQSTDTEFLTPDEVPPVISDVIVTDISSSGVTIKWTTDERTSSQVEYGLTANYGSRTTADGGLLLDHSVSLTRLASQTTYHYRVKSADYWGNSTVSPDATFSTTDVNAPVISGVMVAGITDNSATVVWVTDSAAEGIVEYGVSASYGLVSEFDTRLLTRHSIVLSGLSPGTAYHYKVKSRDASGMWAVSTDRNFTTAGGYGGGDESAALLIDNVNVSEITSSGVSVYWNTSRPATSRVVYGLDENYGSYSAADGELDTSHFTQLTDLKAGSVYHYRVISRDAGGNETMSDDQTFSTSMGRAPLPSLPGWAWTIIGLAGALTVGVMVVKNR